MSVSCILLDQVQQNDNRTQDLNTDIRAYPLNNHGEDCKEGYLVNIKNGEVVFNLRGEISSNFKEGTILSSSSRSSYYYVYGVKFTEQYAIMIYNDSSKYCLAIVNVDTGEQVCTSSLNTNKTGCGEIYVLNDIQFLWAGDNYVALFSFNAESSSLSRLATAPIGSSDYNPWLLRINDTKFLGATDNSSATTAFREITIADNTISTNTRTDQLPYPTNFKAVKLTDNNGYARFLYFSGSNFVYLKVNDTFDISVKTIAAPDSQEYYPLFQATNDSACFITTQSSSSLPHGRYLYTAYLVKIEDDDIQYQISNSGECGMQISHWQARNTTGIGYFIGEDYSQIVSGSSYQLLFPTWYAYADGTIDYTEVLDKTIYDNYLGFAPNRSTVIEWEENEFKIINVLSKYVRTSSNDNIYYAWKTGIATVAKNDRIMGKLISSGTQAIALNSAKTNEKVQCLFSGSTKADWAKSGWKVNTEGVRGYAPQDGIITAYPYYWNMDNPDTIATQQSVTENELETIATNQLYTDLDLSAIEQGQAQTDLEIMILGG